MRGAKQSLAAWEARALFMKFSKQSRMQFPPHPNAAFLIKHHAQRKTQQDHGWLNNTGTDCVCRGAAFVS